MEFEKTSSTLPRINKMPLLSLSTGAFSESVIRDTLMSGHLSKNV